MIRKIVDEFFEKNPKNFVSEKEALIPELIGMQMFDVPLIGVAFSDDPIFKSYEHDDAIIYKQFKTPKKWLSSAKYVVSIFLPYTDAVKKGNARDFKKASPEWLHGRYEGQAFINELSKHVIKEVEALGYNCVVPGLDERFTGKTGTHEITDPEDFKSLTNKDFWSNWSERHVAYAAGLGTFGLSKNIITEKGAAGRFTSFITNLDLDVTPREYEGIYDYCNKCGACIANCPVKAISFEAGKRHTPCSRYLDWVADQNSPRYACGKCQVSVPCQDGIPK